MSMDTCSLHLVLAAALLQTGMVSAETFLIRPNEASKLELTVEKTGLLSGKKHLFTFSRFEGIVEYNSTNPETSQVTFSIDAASADCKDTWVSAKDLRKIQEFALNDMLDASHHPKITFKSSAVRSTGDGKYEVTGSLVLRNIPKPAVVSVSLSKLPGPPVAEGNSRIRLTDYKLKPPGAALGAIGTKNEMTLTFVFRTVQE